MDMPSHVTNPRVVNVKKTLNMADDYLSSRAISIIILAD